MAASPPTVLVSGPMTKFPQSSELPISSNPKVDYVESNLPTPEGRQAPSLHGLSLLSPDARSPLERQQRSAAGVRPS
jgi:hypothetical protein